MPLILDRTKYDASYSGSSPLSIDFKGIIPERVFGLSLLEISHLKISADGVPCLLGDTCVVQGTTNDHCIECHGDFSRVHWLGTEMGSGTMIVYGSIGRHAGQGMTGGQITITGNAGDWLAAELRGGMIHVEGNAGDNAAAALPGSEYGVCGGRITIEGNAGHLAGARMRRGLLAIGGQCGVAAAFELRAGTVIVVGKTGSHAALGMRRGSLISLSVPDEIYPLFRRGVRWEPTFLHALAQSLQNSGFRSIEALKACLKQPWQQWHGDLLTGGRGEFLHPCGLEPANS